VTKDPRSKNVEEVKKKPPNIARKGKHGTGKPLEAPKQKTGNLESVWIHLEKQSKRRRAREKTRTGNLGVLDRIGFKIGTGGGQEGGKRRETRSKEEKKKKGGGSKHTMSKRSGTQASRIGRYGQVLETGKGENGEKGKRHS